MNSRIAAPSTRLVIVGGGPRAIAVLERLGANAGASARASMLQRTSLQVEIVDPHLPGAGRIWRVDQSPLLQMSSRAADVSVFPDETVDCEGPVVAGPSLAEWAEGIRRGEIIAPTAGTERLAEIAALQATDFASRRVQSLYLEWFFGQVLAQLPQAVTVTVHRNTATAVRPAGDRAGWSVELEGQAPLSADLLLLAAGHADTRPAATRHQLAAFARRHGSTYLPPSQAPDAPLDLLTPGHDVIVRGMGPAFVDLMALLTEGRAGHFESDPQGGEPGRLTYRPSGREPRLWVGSHRGVPHPSQASDEKDPVSPDRDPLSGPDDPLAWLSVEAHPSVTRDAVVDHIEHDLRSENSLFTSIGPVLPVHRLQQLLALERAGVVHFLGPRLRVTAEETTGLFVARGAAGVQVRTAALVDAFLPEASLAESTNPLLRDLVAHGTAAVGRESTTSPGTLEVDAQHRVISPDGKPRERLWAIGAWTSERPLDVFARPRTNARCHRVHDALARELRAMALRQGESTAPTEVGERPTAAAVTALTAPSASPVAVARAPRLGVLGPGKIGGALARTALRRGVEVSVTGRSSARALAARLPGARSAELSQLAAGCEVVAITVPLHVALQLDPRMLREVIVIDATNPWGEEDAAAVAAARAAFGDVGGQLTTSELLAARLPEAHVVKTLNHIGYHDVEDQGREDGALRRRAIAVAADDPRAADVVGGLLHRIGFEPVLLGGLAAGRGLEPGAPLFSGWSTREELERLREEQVRVA